MDEIPMEKLIASLRCAVCGQHYKVSELKVLGHRDAMWYLNVHCASCGSRGMMAVVFQDSKERQAVTDLSANEQKQFFGAAPVDSDDLLDIHNFLKNFDGDLGQALTQK